jgi:hypothetical protein
MSTPAFSSSAVRRIAACRNGDWMVSSRVGSMILLAGLRNSRFSTAIIDFRMRNATHASVSEALTSSRHERGLW